MSEELDPPKGSSSTDEITVDITRELVDDSFIDDEDAGRAACLLFLTGPMIGHCVSLNQRPREVGRADTSDVLIMDEGVSRRHARFFLGEADAESLLGGPAEPNAYVEDLDSSNGVYVNGQRIDKIAQLFPGDKITLGTETVLKFTYQGQIDQEFQQRLLDSALNDAMTGLRNRAYFDQQIGYEFDYAARRAGVLALLLFDIDHFKQINDTLGHVAGDMVLQQLGERLRGVVREEDFLARYGGEEFAMICRGLSTEQAFKAAERLRKTVERAPFEYEGEEIAITLSGGVASFPEVMVESAAALIGAADRALYRAKTTGRNQTLKASEKDISSSAIKD